MDLAFTPEELAFREEIRAWVKANLPADISQKVHSAMRLTRDDMSPVARMMAIADVFEALTASDRPYKKAKKLSEAIRIMGFMKKDHHLDPDLLDLFLADGIWKRYAEQFLEQGQIDEPDIAAVLRMRPS